jgi:hypothetical protein
MDPIGSLVKPMDPFSEYFLMQKINYIGIQRKPIILKYIYQMLKKIVIYCRLFPTFLVEGNATFQLEVSENKDVIFFPKFMDPLKSIHGPQVKNPCTRSY